jgi:spermidine/putrescine transport system substrate-binding protein
MSQLNRPSNPSIMMTRRSFLKLSGGGLVAIVGGRLLSACSTPTPTAAPATVAPAATSAPIGGTIDFMSWEGYDLPTCMEEWNKSNNVTISPTYMGDQSEIQAKLSSTGATGYDLISYYHGTADLYINDLKLLQPIDLSQVPNFKELYEFFQTGDYWVKDGVVWGVPFTWGAEGCVYNVDKMEPIQSWQDLLRPEFKGQIALVDDWYGMILMGGIALGMSDRLPNVTVQELDEIKQFLIQLKSQARGIAASYGDQSNMLISGEAIAAFPGWAALTVWAAASGVNLKMNVPAEGGFAFTDAFAIPVGSDNVATTLAWINETLSPAVQACQATALAAGVVNPDAVPLLDEATKAMYGYDDLAEYFKKVKFYGYPPNTSDKYATFEQWNNMWLEVKAA